MLINLFLLIRKGAYLYEYMDSWERFDETSLPDKEAFYSSLNIKYITNVDHRHAKALITKILAIIMIFMSKVIHYCLPMYLKMYFRNKCIEIYELDLAHFLSAPRLA